MEADIYFLAPTLSLWLPMWLCPHPGDLMDSKELRQLETEHGGPVPPR